MADMYPANTPIEIIRCDYGIPPRSKSWDGVKWQVEVSINEDVEIVWVTPDETVDLDVKFIDCWGNKCHRVSRYN